MDAPLDSANVLGLIEADPGLVRGHGRAAQMGSGTHPDGVRQADAWSASAVPGGVPSACHPAGRDRFVTGDDTIPPSPRSWVCRGRLALFRRFRAEHREEVDGFAPVPALSMSLVGDDGVVDYHHGHIRVADDSGWSRSPDCTLPDHIAEAVEPWNWA